MALPGLALGTGTMLGLGLLNILEDSGVAAYAKVAVIGAMGAAVSYGVNKLAIERGAPLAAKRFHGATLVSTVSILAVGAGLFAGTYPSLVLRNVAERQLQEHGAALGEHVAARTASSARVAQAVPALRATVSDLQEKALCEVAAGCISGGAGGYGSVARAMEELAGRAAAIAQQVDAGLAARQVHVGRLNDLTTEYQTTLANDTAGIWERRAALQVIDAKIRQEIGEMGEALPAGLLSAYSAELQAGADIAGRPEVTARLNGILGRHGHSLAAVIASSGRAPATAPSFPRRTGVSDTFAYIGSFAPIAAVTATVDLIFPITFWFYTFWQLVWGKVVHRHAAARSEDGDGMEPEIVTPDSPAPRLSGPVANRRIPRNADHHRDLRHLNREQRANGLAQDKRRARGGGR